jgi:hypothetical protein
MQALVETNRQLHDDLAKAADRGTGGGRGEEMEEKEEKEETEQREEKEIPGG